MFGMMQYDISFSIENVYGYCYGPTAIVGRGVCVVVVMVRV